MDQKEEERLVIERFRKKYAEFPSGKLSSSESPDFVLKPSPKRSIGIELTRLDVCYDSVFENIYASINKKEEKFIFYQKGWFDSIWLIIYVDSLDETRPIKLENKLLNHPFQFSYNKVFVFDLFRDNIFSLIQKKDVI